MCVIERAVSFLLLIQSIFPRLTRLLELRSKAYIPSGWPPNLSPKEHLRMSKLMTSSLGFVSKLLHKSKMPAFTLYGSRGSTNTDRVRLTLAEGGFTDYQLVLLNLQKGEQKVGGSFLLQHDTASPRLSKLYNANAATSSPKKTGNVTRGVKYPSLLSPTGSPSTRVAHSANT
jgi:hypothetical protein